MEPEDEIEVKSKEIQEIIGRVPRWIVRSGISLVFFLVVLLLIGSWMFKYSDAIPGSILLSGNKTENGLKQVNNQNADSIVGKILVLAPQIARVKPGQEVLVRLDLYPQDEYGIIIGKIHSVTLLPESESYLVLVDFPHGMVTTNGKKIIMVDELKGSAEIITEKERILKKIFKR